MVGLSPFAIAPAYGLTGTPAGSASVTPTYTVATFSLLPSAATAGQRCAVTGESGLSGVVCVNTAANTWELETVTATYDLIAAVEWGTTPGTWYDSGGIAVTTANGGKLVDSTNASVTLWDATNSVSVPEKVFAGTIAGFKTIKGDSTSPTDWAKVETPGSGTAVISTSGGVLSMAATYPAVMGAAITSLTLTDASLSSAGNVYLKAMVQIATLSGNSGRVVFAIADGTDSYDFGSGRAFGAATATGQYFDPPIASVYTAQSGAQLGLTAAMVLFEMMKIGTRCMARVAGGIWTDITGATVRSSASKTISVTSLVNPNGSGVAAATLNMQHLAVMRF